MYDYVRRLWQNREKITSIIIIVTFLLVAGIWFHYCLRVRNVSDIGGGADAVGNQLTEAGTAIQHAKDGIESAQGTADQIGAGIGSAKESADYLQHTADTSAELIRQCQQIIAGIRARGKK